MEYALYPLQLQTPFETVFGVVFWGLNTFSDSIWSTREYLDAQFMHNSRHDRGPSLKMPT